ncbi:hypothetical protein [Mycolicibacterium frederiksbergense]|uniref:hypothetical protein n=1 Tax=Mycolicibacterium frederiksbergense TaxID=117567 RepID=UPI002475C975|nr:hypothetical protein [Mycolicibacterium frederiksbergense]
MKLQRLDQVIAEWGIGADMLDPVGWLKRQIKSGRVRAHKMGRHYYMTAEEVRDALDEFASATVEKKAPEVVEERPRGGLSAASMRRRLAS